MAEIVVSAFITVLFDKLGSAALKKVAHSMGIHFKLKKWEHLLPHIQAVLFDAAQKEITEESVKLWVNELQHLAYDIDDVLDDLATRAMDRQFTEDSGASSSKVRKLIPTCCTSFSLSSRMNDKLNNITIKLQNLEERKNTLGLIVKDGKSKHMNRTLETSLGDISSIVGRGGEKRTLLQKLLGDEPCNKNFSVVPIVGLGGIGKTTLARLLYNDTQVNEHFELKAWVCVSDEFDISKISKIILQSVSGENQEFADLNLLQEAIKKRLLAKRFLLVLDDVWSENYAEWEILARPFLVGASGSKIIVTTRKTTVALAMGSGEGYPLQVLSQDDALSLFAQQAFGETNFESHPTLKSYGEGIVKKCDGLPLALIALGRLLRTKDNEEWEELLNSEEWKKESEILPALRLSYHDLPAHLKQLFVYCSLFPKDYLFDKDELVLLWMGEGFLHQSPGSNQMEMLGRRYFIELLSRSFFHHAPNEESLYMMHDLMNDLATSVAGDFVCRLDDELDANVMNEGLEKYRHMSFICQRFGVYKKFKEFQRAKSLRTLLTASVGVKRSQQVFYLSNKVLFEVLPQLPLLRVLSLSNYQINEVPASIGSLKHLRYLNLSRTQITYLPEQVGNLYNLQTLLLCHCYNLEKLPSSFLKLKNLRHLDVSDTPFLRKKMPLGIGMLKSLQTLSNVIIEGGDGFALTELKNIKDLHGRLSIKGLDKVQNAIDAKEANLLQKRMSELEMEWSDVFDGSRNETLEKEILNALNPRNDYLKKLVIVLYGGTQFPSWVGDPSFLYLEHVTILGCKKCTSLPPLGQLPSLKELFVEGMDRVTTVGSEFLGNGKFRGGVAFPSLEILCFKDMKGWEEWSTINGDTGTAFQCLRELRIKRCHKLVKASLESLPSLRVLDICECGDGVLTSLFYASSSLTMLKMVNISGLTKLHGGIIKYLGAVEDLEINWCDEMRYMWESEEEACKILMNLRRLKVFGCDNLVRIGEKEEDSCGTNLTSLRKVDISYCESLKSYRCGNAIETLNMHKCPSITSVSFSRGGQKLKRLYIYDCEKLLEEESGGVKSRVLLSNMSLLESIDIINWPNLKSFPDLSCFVHLTSLRIFRCKNLELFPDEELPKLTSLTNLAITDCQSMYGFFPRGHWPPNLTSLELGGLKHPISEWGPQNFPTSLVSLTLIGRSSPEDVGSSDQLSHLLPSSLTYLWISEFKKLGSLSMGLRHLTSLQKLHIHHCPNLRDLPKTQLPSLLHLEIWDCRMINDLQEMLLPSLLHLDISDCPKIKHLPVTLLPSLLELAIYNCPKLKPRFNRRGSHWPHISHIPCVRIS